MGSHRSSSFWKTVAAVNVHQVAALGAGLLTSVLLARVLGPAGKGTVDLFLLLLGLISEFGLLGTNSGLFYWLANRGSPLGRVHGTGIGIALLFGGVIVLGGLAAVEPLAMLLGGLRIEFATVGILLAPFTLYTALWGNLAIGINRSVLAYQTNTIAALSTLAGLLVLWRTELLTPLHVVELTAAITVVMTAYRVWALMRAAVGVPLQWSADLARKSLRYGIKIYPGFLVNWLHFRVDQIIISNWVGVAGVGVYALSVRLAEMLWLVGYGILNVGMHRIASSDRSLSYSFTRRLCLQVLGLTGLAGVCMALVSYWAIDWLFGDAFHEAYLPLVLLIPGVVAWDCARVLSQYISYNIGKPHINTLIATTGAIVNGIGTLAAVPAYGLLGASAVSSISYTLVLFLTVVIFVKLKEKEG